MKIIYKHRIYPTPELIDFAARQDGCNRKVWNHFISLEREAGHYMTYSEMTYQLTHFLKVEFPFLKKVNAAALQQVLRDLNLAIRRHLSMPKIFGKPRFKKKKWVQSFRIPQYSNVNRKRGLLYLPKLKHPIRIVIERDLPDYTMCTIIREADDKWYACFIVEKKTINYSPRDSVKHLGIDLGLTDLIITSSGERISPPQFFRKSENNIIRKGVALSAKVKGSRRWLKCRKRLSRANSRTKRQRRDFIHKVTTKLANDNEAIAVESLDIHDMSKNHRLSKGIMDAGWGMICNQLEYKLLLRGKVFTSCMGKYPSTQLCSCCGIKTGPKGLQGLETRLWTCTFCGTDHDRDINAAKNIAKQGDQIYLHDYRKYIAAG